MVRDEGKFEEGRRGNRAGGMIIQRVGKSCRGLKKCIHKEVAFTTFDAVIYLYAKGKLQDCVYASLCVLHHGENGKFCQYCLTVLNVIGVTQTLVRAERLVCMCSTHPFSGSLNLLTVTVQVGEDLLAHLFCKTSGCTMRKGVSYI